MTVAEIIEEARELHSGFAREFHPDSTLMRFISTKQRVILGEILKLNSNYLNTEEAIDISVMDEAAWKAGHTLAGVPRLIKTADIVFDNGETAVATRVSLEQKHDARFFPSFYVTGQTIRFCHKFEDWRDVALMNVNYVPDAAALTTVQDSLVLADYAKDALVWATGLFMANRPSPEPVDKAFFAQMAKDSLAALLSSIAHDDMGEVWHVTTTTTH